ncbi:MAG: hypothetical protein K9N21_09580 [Deltaproteobacteria bacterium]|nr:hypothetical protein [Deltaproteobacteria bacterium]
MTSHEFPIEKLGDMALTALRQAVARVMEDHRRRGKPVAIWKDGRVVWKIPDPQGEVQESPGLYEPGAARHDPGQNSAGRKG